MPRWAIVVLAGAALLAGLYFAFRPSSEPAPATVTGPSEVRPATTEETVTVERTRELRITVRDGKPVGGVQRLTVAKGEEVRIRVESDVADEIHLHGYDLAAEVEAGEDAEIEFEATVAGRFEIELEESGVPIAELEVRP